jgi:UDP-N-acetylmuramoylalanine-D-glutamate ligase
VSHDPFLAKPRVYFGPSLGLDAPHVLLEAMLPAPEPEWPELLARSIVVARELAVAFPSSAALLTSVAGELVRMNRDMDPWRAWVTALVRVHDVPDWPMESELPGDGRIVLRAGCAYPAVLQWARAALHILQLAAALPPAGPSRERMQELHGKLPPRPIMALHHALSTLDVPWIIIGKNQTRIGFGSRQQMVTGVPRDPAGLARRLAAEGHSIPVYTVTGSIGKTTTVRLLASLLEGAGARVGFTCSYGSFVAGRQLETGDRIGARAALRLLVQPDVDAAVLELGRRGLLFSGMPLRRTDVAVLINVEDVHVGVNEIETVEHMAEVKGLTLRHARIAVLNHDDPHCRRLGEARDAAGLVWFSREGGEKALRTLSRAALAALGVERDAAGAPAALTIWIDGKRQERLSLAGVAPYHGLLGEKTVEELLAAVAAARFGPLAVPDIAAALPDLRLDASTHLFRTSVHPRGRVLFVLEKAAEAPTMHLVRATIDELCSRHGIVHRIAIFCRAATQRPDAMHATLAALHGFVDELVYFDRPDAYDPKITVPGIADGSLPDMMADDVARLNEERGTDIPIHLVADWDAAAGWLQERLARLDGPTLVLLNQSGTALFELSRSIVAFVDAWQDHPSDFKSDRTSDDSEITATKGRLGSVPV